MSGRPASCEYIPRVMRNRLSVGTCTFDAEDMLIRKRWTVEAHADRDRLAADAGCRRRDLKFRHRRGCEREQSGLVRVHCECD